MFKLARNPEFTHTVKALIPADGGHEEQSFRARFRLLSAEDMAVHNLFTAEGTETFLKTVLVGLEDIVDEDGNPIPYSDGLRDQVISSIPARVAMIQTYNAACSKARVGN